MPHPYLSIIADDVWSGLVQCKTDDRLPIRHHIDCALRQYLSSGAVYTGMPKIVSGTHCSGSLVYLAIQFGGN